MSCHGEQEQSLGLRAGDLGFYLCFVPAGWAFVYLYSEGLGPDGSSLGVFSSDGDPVEEAEGSARNWDMGGSRLGPCLLLQWLSGGSEHSLV